MSLLVEVGLTDLLGGELLVETGELLEKDGLIVGSELDRRLIAALLPLQLLLPLLLTGELA